MTELYPLPLDTITGAGTGVPSGAEVRVRSLADDNEIPFYNAPDATTPVAQPAIADQYGRILPRWVPAGAHVLVIGGSGGVERRIPFTVGTASKMSPELAGSVASVGSVAAAQKTADGAVSPLTAPGISSWWQNEVAFRNPDTGETLVGNITRPGLWEAAVLDPVKKTSRRVPLTTERVLQDDHLSVGWATRFDLNRRPVAAYSAHNRDQYLRIREGATYGMPYAFGPEQRLVFPFEATTTNGSDSVTWAGHGLDATAVGTAITWQVAPAGSGFVAGTTYFIAAVVGSGTVKLAATAGGSTIVATATGTGLLGEGLVSYGSLIPKSTEANLHVTTVGASDVLTAADIAGAPVSHGYRAGRMLRFTKASVVPPFVAGQTYWVTEVPTASTFKLAAKRGGTAVVATTTISGSGAATNAIGDSGAAVALCRVNGKLYLRRTTDMLVSVTERATTTPMTFAAEVCKLADKAYCHTTFSTSGANIYCLLTDDATPAPLTNPVTTYTFKVTLTGNGPIRNRNGDIIGYLFADMPAPGAPMIDVAQAGTATGPDLLYTATGNEGLRLLDVSQTGDSVLAIKFDRRDFDVTVNPDDTLTQNQSGRAWQNGGTLGMFRYPSATNAAAVWEPIGPVSPFGAIPSAYLAGSCFERGTDDVIIRITESAGVWKAVRTLRTGAQYPSAPGATYAPDTSINGDGTIYTAPTGWKLRHAKPAFGAQVLAAGKREVLIWTLPRYSIANFTDWDGLVRLETY